MPNFIHIVLYAFYLSVFVWLIYKWKWFKLEYVSSFQLTVFFLLKVIAGVTLTLIYTYYYTDPTKADIYRYFNDSVVISKVLFKEPVIWLKIMLGLGIDEAKTFEHLVQTMYFSHPEADVSTNNTLIIRVSSVFNYLSYFNIYINTLFFNFICFVGLTALLKALAPYFSGDLTHLSFGHLPSPKEREEPNGAFSFKLILLPLFLMPSVVFWGSGLLKEQLLFALIGAYIYIHNRIIYKTGFVTWALMALLLWAMYAVKPSVAACLLMASVFLPGFKVNQTRQTAGVLLAAALLLMVGISLDWHYKLNEMLINKRNEFVTLAVNENAGSYFDARIFEPGIKSVIALIPSAIVNAVFRPFVWEGGKAFQLVFAMENTLFLLLILYILVRYFKLAFVRGGSPFRELEGAGGQKRLLFLFCLVFAISNYLIIGITVPIMGAIVHYRVIAAPFLLLAVLLLTEQKKCNP